MFLFQLLDKIEDDEVDVRWFTKGKRKHSVIARSFDLPWYLYFKRVVYLDKYINEDGSVFWLCEVK